MRLIANDTLLYINAGKKIEAARPDSNVLYALDLDANTINKHWENSAEVTLNSIYKSTVKTVIHKSAHA